MIQFPLPIFPNEISRNNHLFLSFYSLASTSEERVCAFPGLKIPLIQATHNQRSRRRSGVTRSRGRTRDEEEPPWGPSVSLIHRVPKNSASAFPEAASKVPLKKQQPRPRRLAGARPGRGPAISRATAISSHLNITEAPHRLAAVRQIGDEARVTRVPHVYVHAAKRAARLRETGAE